MRMRNQHRLKPFGACEIVAGTKMHHTCWGTCWGTIAPHGCQYRNLPSVPPFRALPPPQQLRPAPLLACI
eukprot:856172-Pelagomonas_calceolata.AAC.4